MNSIIKTNIPCRLVLPGQKPINAHITAIVRSFTGDPYSFRAIIDGTSYSLEYIWINERRLPDFNNEEEWYLNEWFSAMKYQHEKHRTEYYFTEIGLEYCYSPDDFKRHFTRDEG